MGMNAKENLLRTVDRDQVLLFGSHNQMLYERGVWLCGMENFMVALHTDRERIQRLIRGIAAPDQGMPFPRENIEAFVNTVRKHGRYPLKWDR